MMLAQPTKRLALLSLLYIVAGSAVAETSNTVNQNVINHDNAEPNVKTKATEVNTLSNSADASSSNLRNNTPAIDLEITKSVIPTQAEVGDIVTYTLIVRNNGPATATNIRVEDKLPAGVTYLSDDSAGNYNPSTGIWQIPQIANGANVILNLSVTVD